MPALAVAALTISTALGLTSETRARQVVLAFSTGRMDEPHPQPISAMT